MLRASTTRWTNIGVILHYFVNVSICFIRSHSILHLIWYWIDWPRLGGVKKTSYSKNCIVIMTKIAVMLQVILINCNAEFNIKISSYTKNQTLSTLLRVFNFYLVFCDYLWNLSELHNAMKWVHHHFFLLQCIVTAVGWIQLAACCMGCMGCMLKINWCLIA